MKIRFLLPLLIVIALPLTILAQVTTGNINGIVKTKSGQPLVGATVTATHEPTGTVYRVQTRNGGRYDIPNMIAGGPYTITVSFTGFENGVKSDFTVNLGGSERADFVMGEKAVQIKEVVISGAARQNLFNSKGGTETTIGRDKIQNLTSVGRNLNDYLRFTPQAKTDAFGGISIAGQNNRYNSLFIDGALNNDVFGLSSSGTNGGQSSVSPISIDAIDQFQVMLNPYDAALSNFTGAGINATTRRGTNTTTGSVYISYRNSEMAGKTPTDLPTVKRTKLFESYQQMWGFRIGGPIIKNKLFYFINYEKEDVKRSQPFDSAAYQGKWTRIQPGATTDTISMLYDTLRTRYGYEPGGFMDNPETISASRFVGRFDWNADANNKFTLSYRYLKADRFNTTRSSNTTVNFYNNGQINPNTTHSASFEWNTKLGKRANNKFLGTYTKAVDDRNIIGQAFPAITVANTTTRDRAVFGTEPFSPANYLKQQVVGIYDEFKLSLGEHNLKAGVDIELTSAYNLFIRQNFGAYTFNSMNEFFQGKVATYNVSFSLRSNNKGDAAKDAAADFDTRRMGFFINDEIRVNENLTFNLGFRADKFDFLTNPALDKFFRDTAAAVISQYYDLRGARVGTLGNPKWQFSPRFGFNLKIDDENLVVRGGTGLFLGRLPLVWPGGLYTNNGVSIGGLSLSGAAAASITFKPDPYNQYGIADFPVANKGELNLIQNGFRLPQVLKANLGVDKFFGNGWKFTTELSFIKNLYEVGYRRVDILPPTLKQAQNNPLYFDRRNVYSGTNVAPQIDLNPYVAGVQTPYTFIYLMENQQGKKGWSFQFTSGLEKSWKNGFAFFLYYVYGHAMINNEVTSSQNSSQWNTMESVNGRNFLTLSTSDFDIKHRIISSVAKRFEYFNKNVATTFTLSFIGQSGNPFSYTYANSPVRDLQTNSGNDLIFVPTKAQLAQMVAAGQFVTVSGNPLNAQQQADALDAYIENDKYLSKRRGQYAERNGARLPFVALLDLTVQQDFYVTINRKRHNVQLRWDVSNFTNMLNPRWGRQYFATNDQFQLINFRGFQSTNPAASNYLVPTYNFAPLSGTGKPYSVGDGLLPTASSRWISQITLRYSF
jgi:hypothetical protein